MYSSMTSLKLSITLVTEWRNFESRKVLCTNIMKFLEIDRKQLLKSISMTKESSLGKLCFKLLLYGFLEKLLYFSKKFSNNVSLTIHCLSFILSTDQRFTSWSNFLQSPDVLSYLNIHNPEIQCCLLQWYEALKFIELLENHLFHHHFWYFCNFSPEFKKKY